MPTIRTKKATYVGRVGFEDAATPCKELGRWSRITKGAAPLLADHLAEILRTPFDGKLPTTILVTGCDEVFPKVLIYYQP